MSLEDEWAIRKLVDRYALAVDAGDADALAALFTEDGVLASPRGRNEGHAAIRAIPDGMRQRYNKTFHAMLNHVAEVDGNHATATTYAIAKHLIDAPMGNHICYEMTIRYADELVKTADGWKFKLRVLHADWTHVYQINPGE